MLNERSLDTLCAALCGVMGVDAPAQAAPACEPLMAYAAEKLAGRKADRVLMFNPDAVAQWIYEKYPQLLKGVLEKTELEVPFRTVMPSVTPVCFGTMYTGAQPAVHGIEAYAKPVIKIDTIFDALLRAGKKPAIIATPRCSLANIFLEREMDYFPCPSVGAVNAKAAQLILEDKHDFIVVYNGNYDAVMHKTGPESIEALSELRSNAHTFAMLHALVEERWKQHNTLMAFSMDHGCHETDGNRGSHGLATEEDLNIVHRFTILPAQE